MRLSGWQRLGVVLSILWIIFSIFLVYSFNSAGETTFTKFIIDENAEPLVQQSFESDDEYSLRPAKTVLDYGAIAKVMFIPILFMWIIAGTAIYSVRWVLKGFKNHEDQA